MEKEIQFQPVAVIILNWNGKKYLERFIPVLLGSTYTGLKVYVADNGSTDDSVDFLIKTYPEVIILAESTNEGFAGGYNRAISKVPEELIVLLNSDIEITPGWIEPAISMLMADPGVGAVQPKIMDFNNRQRFEYAGAAGGWIDQLGYTFSMGRIFDVIETDDGQYNKAQPIFWASGAAMFTRKSLFMQLGGFDPYFFAHQEEIDLCWRMQLAGYRIVSCPDVKVYHIGGGTLAKDNPKKVFLNFRNNLIMLWKNLDGTTKYWVMICRFALDAVSAWKNLLGGQPSYFTAVMKAHGGFFHWLIFDQKQSVGPKVKSGSLNGMYFGSVVWQHFIKKKTRFSEIVESAN
jgi:GT2 family glycosyltransferase